MWPSPSTTDVAAILRARTIDGNGVEVGAFTTETRPTAEQVGTLIAEAVGDVYVVGPASLPEVLWPAATRLATIGAALLVELSYYPEQVATGRSPYPQLLELYESSLRRLEAAKGAGGIDVDGDGILDGAMPMHTFPPDMGGLVGWGTRF